MGETYLFVGSDSPKRAHLAGHPFTVTSIEKVYRKIAYRKGKRSMKVTRFFNDDGIGARPEELEPLPANEWVKCNLCSAYANISEIKKIKEDNNDIAVKCPNCNAGPEYLINYPANETQADRGHGFCPKCDYPLTNWGAASDGDGDIYDEIGCDRCEEVIRKEHASYCTCPECDPWGLKSEEQDREALPVPLCIGCNKKASELEEYIEAAQECETTPEEYARTEEGTYNPVNGHFLCTSCYISKGMPTAPGGWVAP